jgi:regulatory protein
LNPKPQLQPDDAIAVEASAVRLLAGREHTRLELQRKLRARHADEALVETVLDDLERRGLLSDERFAERYVEQRGCRGYGPLRIRAELAERGIGGELATRWLDDGHHDWSEILADAAAGKFGSGPVSDRRELAKRGRFLEQRGFPIGLVRRYLDRVRGF